MSYGQEQILDLSGCDVSLFTRAGLTRYFEELCELIEMKREDLHFWDYDDEEEKAAAPVHLDGTSAVQFIKTSNVVVHTLDKVGECYINIFSCKPFSAILAGKFTKKFFKAKIENSRVIERGRNTKCKL